MRLQFGPGRGMDTVADPGSVDVSLDDAGRFQHFEVLGNRGLGQGQFVDEGTAHTGIFPDQDAQNGDAGGVSQGLGPFGEPNGIGGKVLDFWSCHVIQSYIAKIR